MEFKSMLRRVAGAGIATGFVATLLVGGAQGAQAATPIQIVNANTGTTCLTLKTIQDFKGAVTTATCDKDNPSMVWVVANGIIRNPKSGHCLDADGTNVYTFPCAKPGEVNAWQLWNTTSGDKKWITHRTTQKDANSSGANNERVYLKPREQASRWFWRTV
ncbi:RICIN domain-containing protein [Lentzea sp. NPDC051838]|uniref:RICIN domain-containing protein n=1 Tax=Lentzea sp. NPDC051838 TaxID=3154849 RepID=UPI0034147D90